MPPADQWSGTSIVNIPMGQGIAVTPMQMAVAFSTVANNGVAVKPRLIAQVGDAVYDDAARHRVIPATVARDVRSMLATAVAEGTGTRRRSPATRSPARRAPPRRRCLTAAATRRPTTWRRSSAWSPPTTRGSWCWSPSTRRTRSIYGGDIAAPAVQKIMRFALQQLEIAP